MAKTYTHVLSSIALLLVIARALGVDGVLFVSMLSVGFIASIIPDFDLLFRHRATFHNIFVPIGFSVVLLFSYYMGRLCLYDMLLLDLAFSTGFFSHILLDLVTEYGVSLFYPVRRRRISTLKLGFNNKLLNYGISILSIIIISLYFYTGTENTIREVLMVVRDFADKILSIITPPR